MEDEIKKRTAIAILEKKLVIHHGGKKSAILAVFQGDFPAGLEMNFLDIGYLLRTLEKERPGEIHVESVASMETDLEYFLSNELLNKEQLIKPGSFYKVKYTPKEKIKEITKGVEYREDKGMAYLLFSKNRKVNLGKKTTRTARLARAFMDPTTYNLGLSKRNTNIFSEIYISKDANKSDMEKNDIVHGTLKEINRKIKQKNIPVRLSITGQDIYELEVIYEDLS